MHIWIMLGFQIKQSSYICSYYLARLGLSKSSTIPFFLVLHDPLSTLSNVWTLLSLEILFSTCKDVSSYVIKSLVPFSNLSCQRTHFGFNIESDMLLLWSIEHVWSRSVSWRILWSVIVIIFEFMRYCSFSSFMVSSFYFKLSLFHLFEHM